MAPRYNARALRASWERQQNSLVIGREMRFNVLLTVLKAGTRARARILDLGCGTGAFSERILRELPGARVWGVDYDPVLLRIGREGLRAERHRLEWVEADLRSPTWTRALPRGRWDAIVSTTALHWIEPAPLSRLYGTAARLLRPGGIFLNGDNLPFDPPSARLRRLMRALRRERRARKQAPGVLDWDEWWARTRSIRELAPEFRERDRRYPHPHDDERVNPISWHLRTLRAKGFRESAVVWQYFSNRVVIGIR